MAGSKSDWAVLAERYMEFHEALRRQFMYKLGSGAGIRPTGVIMDEACWTPPVVYHNVTPCPPSWLAPRCKHWSDWRFPKVHVDA